MLRRPVSWPSYSKRLPAARRAFSSCGASSSSRHMQLMVSRHTRRAQATGAADAPARWLSYRGDCIVLGRWWRCCGRIAIGRSRGECSSGRGVAKRPTERNGHTTRARRSLLSARGSFCCLRVESVPACVSILTLCVHACSVRRQARHSATCIHEHATTAQSRSGHQGTVMLVGSTRSLEGLPASLRACFHSVISVPSAAAPARAAALHASLLASGGCTALHTSVSSRVTQHAAIGPELWRVACAHARAIADAQAAETTGDRSSVKAADGSCSPDVFGASALDEAVRRLTKLSAQKVGSPTVPNVR